MDVAQIIDRLRLTPHPEGGHFRETYRAAETIAAAALPRRFGGERSISTAIHFLLEAGQCSRLHRIRADEVWHFYAGDPLIVVEIDPAGRLKTTRLGGDLAAGGVYQHVVPAGVWFGAAPAENGRFALVGCTVAPGFDFADFELAERAALLAEYPGHREWILRLT
ncbi:cupin domain-containing protein [Dongia sedimenti]|uniref:Cupin domain-containing protein n=1 Tax=Dongia sedimenti TaxID=3064282 RepID=A0ABU0YFE6_9PROT|nr:cupin domain-containing protein [Rhodospirillaceae bacterium R-7]